MIGGQGERGEMSNGGYFYGNAVYIKIASVCVAEDMVVLWSRSSPPRAQLTHLTSSGRWWVFHSLDTYEDAENARINVQGSLENMLGEVYLKLPREPTQREIYTPQTDHHAFQQPQSQPDPRRRRPHSRRTQRSQSDGTPAPEPACGSICKL